jgi:hypothetical protein
MIYDLAVHKPFMELAPRSTRTLVLCRPEARLMTGVSRHWRVSGPISVDHVSRIGYPKLSSPAPRTAGTPPKSRVGRMAPGMNGEEGAGPSPVPGESIGPASKPALNQFLAAQSVEGLTPSPAPDEAVAAYLKTPNDQTVAPRHSTPNCPRGGVRHKRDQMVAGANRDRP